METPANEITFKSPVLIKRVKAIIIDGLFLLFLMFIAAAVFDDSDTVPGWLRGAVLFCLLFVYEPLLITIGSTLGHKIMRVRVRSISNTNRRINILRSYARFFIKLLLGLLSFITVHFNKERRAIHDFAGHSVMIDLG